MTVEDTGFSVAGCEILEVRVGEVAGLWHLGVDPIIGHIPLSSATPFVQDRIFHHSEMVAGGICDTMAPVHNACHNSRIRFEIYTIVSTDHGKKVHDRNVMIFFLKHSFEHCSLAITLRVLELGGGLRQR